MKCPYCGRELIVSTVWYYDEGDTEEDDTIICDHCWRSWHTLADVEVTRAALKETKDKKAKKGVGK